jgi:putative ABC transport system permease protein
MYRQVQLLIDTKLGFDKEQLLAIENQGDYSDWPAQYERFKSLVYRLPEIESIGCGRNAPVGIINDIGVIKRQGAIDEEARSCRIVNAFDNYLPTIRANIIAGSDFTESKTGNQLVMSRKMVEDLGETPESIIGKEYEIRWRTDGARVVGVVDDIQFNAYLTKNLQSNAIVFWNISWSPGTIVVRVSKGDWRYTISQLEKAWKEAVPAWPFHYEMMDERLRQNYQKELADINVITAFSLIAIILSCFGVMGISHYTARQRTKEIAIRKVNGATKKDILLLLNAHFLILNFISFIIAIPVVVLFINRWLQIFSYKTNLNWWVFLLAGLTTTVVVVTTVSWQSWRAANANPAEVLKSE